MNELAPYLIPLESIDSELEALRESILLNLGSLGAGFSQELVAELVDSLEVVNSYFSNRMEGNPTKIRDVFDAIEGRIEGTVEERNFKLEHRAHVYTTKYLKDLVRNETAFSTCRPESISLIHKIFFENLPEALRKAKTQSGINVDIVPGIYRDRHVSVGKFIPPAPEDINDLLIKFSKAYELESLDPSDRLLSMASAHHRLLYIHPFSDGNGRVARILTELMLVESGYDGLGLYSVSRGLARDIPAYNNALKKADFDRRHDADGRGARSLEGLIDFSKYFLSVMNDQISFMKKILSRASVEKRLDEFLKTQLAMGKLNTREASVLKHILHFGNMSRGEVQAVASLKERQASALIIGLIQKEYVKSPSPKGRLSFKLSKDLRIALLKEFFDGE